METKTRNAIGLAGNHTGLARALILLSMLDSSGEMFVESTPLISHENDIMSSRLLRIL
jgi:hypothetical protein